MIVLRALDAGFTRADLVVEPFSFALRAGESVDLRQPHARAASTAARMCAAIVKPSAGTIFVGDYETRLQPPQAKRRVGFVDAAGFEGDAHAFRCEVAFRADVWGLRARVAQQRARDCVAILGSDAYARAIALALVADVASVVLDQAASTAVDRLRSLVPSVGIVRTMVAALEWPTDVTAFAEAAR